MIARALLAALALLAGAPLLAQNQVDVEAQDAAARARVVRAVADSGFQGVYRVDVGQRRIAGGSAGASIQGRPGGFQDQAQWPWASITREVIATLVLQEVESGRIALDAPASRYLPAIGARAPTVRQLLRHRAGLRGSTHPSGDANGLPSLDLSGPAGVAWCLGGRGAAGSAGASDDCDAVVLGAVLERATGTTLIDLFAQRIGGTLGLAAGFIDPQATAPDARWPGGPTDAERRAIARLGPVGGMVGTAADLAALDQGLLAGALLSNDARAELWRAGGMKQAARVQGSFTASLKGCPGPVRIVERRGGVGRFGVRNVILPDLGLSLVLFTNRADADASFGELSQGSGATYAILSAAACA